MRYHVSKHYYLFFPTLKALLEGPEQKPQEVMVGLYVTLLDSLTPLTVMPFSCQ